LCIKYSIPELIWYQRNVEGDHYLKSNNGKGPEIESWSIFLSLDDPLRQEIKDEMIKRRDIFLEALLTNRVELLPRLMGLDKKIKCKWCPFMEKCWGLDEETPEAMQLATELNIIDRILSAYHRYDE
jgi:hypothetical protein